MISPIVGTLIHFKDQLSVHKLFRQKEQCNAETAEQIVYPMDEVTSNVFKKNNWK